MTEPPANVVARALEVAAQSPCRSKRGVVVFGRDYVPPLIAGDGFNSPPGLLGCPGRDRCAGTCGQRSVHAEVRALRDAAWWRARFGVMKLFDLVHVELSLSLSLMLSVRPCAGPTCPGCAAQILDVGFIDGVWLYEESVRKCLACRRFEDSSARVEDRLKRCSECGADLVPQIAWRRYTAREFYDATHENLVHLRRMERR